MSGFLPESAHAHFGSKRAGELILTHPGKRKNPNPTRSGFEFLWSAERALYNDCARGPHIRRLGRGTGGVARPASWLNVFTTIHSA